MRHLVLRAGLIASAVLGTAAAHAAHHHHHAIRTRSSNVSASQCAPERADTEAFNVTGLKSELMVTALSCNEQDKYNAFVAKFHPDLIAEEATLNRYFSRTFGRGAQKAHDDYITQLANVQAERGLQAGVAFCQQRMSMFDEVEALDNASDLDGYAHGKDIVQPADFQTCSAPSSGEHEAHVRRIAARTTQRHH